MVDNPPRFDDVADRAPAGRADAATVIVLDRLPDPALQGANCCTFGNFDGVHRGHRALLAMVVAHAKAAGGQAIALTFDPHPLRLLRPERAPRAIDSLQDRLAGLRATGIDIAVVLRFDAELAAQPAAWFAEEVLFGALGARCVVIGHDTRFGQGGTGDAALLRAIAAQRGATVASCAPVVWGGAEVSSSRIRKLLEAGEVEAAADLLGRPWRVQAEVVHGDARGRTIGFPTANLRLGDQLAPAHGVYAGWLHTAAGQILPAVANCGVRPTFGATTAQLEVHCLDFSGDLYHQRVRFDVVGRLRGEQRFDGIAALRAQIAADVAAARALLASLPAP